MNFELDFDNLTAQDLHMHTDFSDGTNSPAEMIVSAAVMGIKNIGISDHSYTFFDESYCIGRNRTEEYKNVIRMLQKKFSSGASRITKMTGGADFQLHLGIEQDYYSNESTADYDYIIGSVHYVRVDAAPFSSIVEGCLKYDKYIYIPVDESAEILKNAVKEYFAGDIFAFTEQYFLTLSDIVRRTGADIIGHFDLVQKFNENGALFDSKNERFVSAWKNAADELLKTDAVFEINTGAMARGYRSDPYPAEDMISYIKDHGGKFILSSDAHNTSTIAYNFNDAAELL